MEETGTIQDSSHKLEERRRLLLAVMLIAITAALAYVNTLNNEFVFDDVKIIRDNPTIRSFSNVPRIFANMFADKPVIGEITVIDPSYRPMRFFSYVIDYRLTSLLFGTEDITGEDYPLTMFHISNILYHILAAMLVFIVLRRFTGHYGAALGIALIFVVHPVHTESVAYLTGRKDIICTIFFLLFSSL